MTPPRLVPGGGVIYVTGTPCYRCFQRMVQSEIKEFYVANRQGTQLESDATRRIIDKLIQARGVKVVYMDAPLDWLAATVGYFQESLGKTVAFKG